MRNPHPELNTDQISGYFRANVGILILDKNGFVFVGERTERPGSWQLPQGGIDQDEDEETAVAREMNEEIGLDEKARKELLHPLGTHPGWFAYQLPQENWSVRNGRGQAQKFYAFQLVGENKRLDNIFFTHIKALKHAGREPEFSDRKWARISDVINDAWEIRQSVYKAVAQAFSEYLA